MSVPYGDGMYPENAFGYTMGTFARAPAQRRGKRRWWPTDGPWPTSRDPLDIPLRQRHSPRAAEQAEQDRDPFMRGSAGVKPKTSLKRAMDDAHLGLGATPAGAATGRPR